MHHGSPHGDDSRPHRDDYAALVEGILNQAAEAEAVRSRPHRNRSRGVILGVLLVNLVLAGGWSVWSMTRPPAPLTPREQEASLAGALYVLSQQLEAHRARQGEYPASLEAVSPPVVGITYRLEGKGYVLEGRAHGTELTHASWEDAGGLAALNGSRALQEMSR